MANVIKNAELFYNDLAVGGSSDKVYLARVVKDGTGYSVPFEFGRRGGTLQCGHKAKCVSLEEAIRAFDAIVAEKERKGYSRKETDVPIGPAEPVVRLTNEKRTPYPVEDLEEVDQQNAPTYLHSAKFWLQPKFDGHYCQIQKIEGNQFCRFNKLGGAVNNIPSEVVADLRRLKAKTFFLVGELVGTRFHTFDLVEVNGKDLSRQPYGDRFTALENTILANARNVVITAVWRTTREKLAGLAALHQSRAEGGVFKEVGALYRSAGHVKIKFIKSLSAIVMATQSDGHNNATLGLYDKNVLREVGRCSLNGKPEVKIGDIIEVLYLYGSEGFRLVQPRMKCVRTDIKKEQCVLSQIIQKGIVEPA